MYLSRLILNPHSRQVQRELADAYQMHRTILRAFPNELSKVEERVLFRLELDSTNGIPTILIQSQTRPDWDWLKSTENSYLLPGITDNPGVKEFELDLKPGQVLAFRLRANPTVKKSNIDSGNDQGKRVGLIKEDDQVSWLTRKIRSAGCDIIQVRASACDQVFGYRKGEGRGTRISFLSVQFDGILQVNEPPLLVSSVKQGIGSAKGFGFGLLSLAPFRGI